MIFDKADRAEKIHTLKKEAQSLADEIKEIEVKLSKAGDEVKPSLKAEIDRRKERIELLENIINKVKEQSND